MYIRTLKNSFGTQVFAQRDARFNTRTTQLYRSARLINNAVTYIIQ